jgi:hypothetical protein
LVTILLLAILAGAIFVGHYGWVSAGDVAMPAWGWLMLGLGIFFSLLVGVGPYGLAVLQQPCGFDEATQVVKEKKHQAAKEPKLKPNAKKGLVVDLTRVTVGSLS